jgi:hypothetical protein
MKLANEQKTELKKIYALSQRDMAYKFRFAPAGHPWFDITKPYYRHFERRFKKLGGMTVPISKEIGWK